MLYGCGIIPLPTWEPGGKYALGNRVKTLLKTCVVDKYFCYQELYFLLFLFCGHLVTDYAFICQHLTLQGQ